MKWLLIRLLGLLTFLTAVVGIGAAIIAYDGEQGMLTGIARSFLVGAVFWGFAAMFDSWSTKIKRGIPPRNWVPPKPRKEAKVKSPSAEIIQAEPLPHATTPRRFAPPPVAQAVDPSLEDASPSLPSHLRHFIEIGERAIYAPQEQETDLQAEVILGGGADVPDAPIEERGRFLPPKGS